MGRITLHQDNITTAGDANASLLGGRAFRAFSAGVSGFPVEAAL